MTTATISKAESARVGKPTEQTRQLLLNQVAELQSVQTQLEAARNRADQRLGSRWPWMRSLATRIGRRLDPQIELVRSELDLRARVLAGTA